MEDRWPQIIICTSPWAFIDYDKNYLLHYENPKEYLKTLERYKETIPREKIIEILKNN